MLLSNANHFFDQVLHSIFFASPIPRFAPRTSFLPLICEEVESVSELPVDVALKLSQPSPDMLVYKTLSEPNRFFAVKNLEAYGLGAETTEGTGVTKEQVAETLKGE